MTSAQIKLWKRFIDDCIGIWRGSKRSFDAFVTKLNAATKKFGIYFPPNEIQFGNIISFLDVMFYIGENNIIHYRSYTKPTDAKRYLRPQSFHPQNVFKAVPFSQMISTMERNSEQIWREKEMKKLIEDFKKSGYDEKELLITKDKVMEHMANNNEQNETDTITFPVYFFEELKDFRKILRDSATDIQTLIGDTRIVLAIKKNPSIGNTVVKNKELCSVQLRLENQKCNAQNCQQCPLINTSNQITVNNMTVRKQ